MKYIRTKEHLIAKITAEDKNTISYENNFISGCLWKEDNNFQVANTIEELCDEYVYKEEVIDKRLLETYRKLGREIYGAIWTSKGLIYVAKMNDKGELELL